MKMTKKVFYSFIKGVLFTLMWMISFGVFAQNITVRGSVRDSKGEPLIGVTVKVSGTTTGTITDVNGNFTLANVPSNATLEFSYVGMKTQTVSVDGRTTINVVMEEEAVALEEVVAIGYGYMKKNL